jgi:hypothetical protein
VGWLSNKFVVCLAGNCGYCHTCENGVLPSDAAVLKAARDKKESEDLARLQAEGDVLEHLLDRGREASPLSALLPPPLPRHIRA